MLLGDRLQDARYLAEKWPVVDDMANQAKRVSKSKRAEERPAD
jgi:hypothetical protein